MRVGAALPPETSIDDDTQDKSHSMTLTETDHAKTIRDTDISKIIGDKPDVASWTEQDVQSWLDRSGLSKIQGVSDAF